MTVTEDDDSSDEFFDATNDVNIMLHALYRAARTRNRTMAEAENWFEVVSAKFAIAGICHALTYTKIYSGSGVRGINEYLTTSGYTPMFANTLQMINNSIVDIKSGQYTALPVVFHGLPDNEDLLTGLCHEPEGLYAAFLEAAWRLQ